MLWYWWSETGLVTNTFIWLSITFGFCTMCIMSTVGKFSYYNTDKNVTFSEKEKICLVDDQCVQL